MRYSMELNHLKVFFEVAKAGRFTEAARRLNISQSALSRSVALLEDSEGVQLFERSKFGVTLTPTGTEVFRHCELLFQTVGKIGEVCRGTQETCEGVLHFSTTDHIVNYLLPSRIRAFRQEFPQVIPSVHIEAPDEIVHLLLNSENEFGLSFAKVQLPQIEYEALSEEAMSLVVREDLWRENKVAGQSATINRILDRVGYISSLGAHKQTRASRVLRELFGRMPRISFEANGQEAQKRVCLAGGGLAYLSRFMVESEIKSGQLFEIKIEAPHRFKLWLATKKGHVLTLPAKLFLDRLRSSLV